MPETESRKRLENWKKIRASKGYRNALLFFVFVVVSAIFWFILALNDSAQSSFNVGVNINNLPDSVTFINDIPSKIHVTVRDKGTNLWRKGVLRKPVININFQEYSDGKVLKLTHTDIQSLLKGIFGSSAQITAVSSDSIVLAYTTNKGKQVPVLIDSNIVPASGFILDGRVEADPKQVLIYGDKRVLDTIHSVSTDFLEVLNISETQEDMVNLKQIQGVRIKPGAIKVIIPIEPLVKKEAMISLTAINEPHGQNLLLFPSKVPVSYYVAMSRLGDDDDASIELSVDFNSVHPDISNKVPVKVSKVPERIKNLVLKNDSVEYVIVKE